MEQVQSFSTFEEAETLKTFSLNVDSVAKGLGMMTYTGYCERHGEFMTYVPMHEAEGKTVVCPKCRQEAEAKQAMAETHQAFFAHLQKKAQVPTRYAQKGFQAYEAQEAGQAHVKAVCLQYAENFHLHKGRSMILSGGVGTGKTHLALAIVNHLLRTQQAKCFFTTVTEMSKRIKQSWDKHNLTRDYRETEADLMSLMTKPDLLVLDEVGLAQSEFDASWLFDLINQRYNEQKSTIIITNLSMEDLKSYLGERLMDRLREDRGIALLFSWRSYRASIQQVGQ